MQQKVIITLSIILALVIGVLLYSNTQETEASTEEEIDINTYFETPKLEEDNLTQVMKLEEKEFNSSIPLAGPKLLAQEDLDELIDIYKEIDKEELLETVSPKKMVTPMMGIQIEKNNIANLFVGDTIKLPNVGQVEYTAKITKRVEHNNGSVSVAGNLISDENAKYSVTLTEGKTTSYASITTPEGAFEVETIDGVGYIYSVKDIEDKYIDSNKEDFLTPNHDGPIDVHEH